MHREIVSSQVSVDFFHEICAHNPLSALSVTNALNLNPAIKRLAQAGLVDLAAAASLITRMICMRSVSWFQHLLAATFQRIFSRCGFESFCFFRETNPLTREGAILHRTAPCATITVNFNSST
jgi:hypothetical protein